jgi:hypothetical protein
MSLNDISCFCNAIQSKLCTLDPSSTCTLGTFLAPVYVDVVVCVCDPDSGKQARWWKTVLSESEIFELVQNVTNEYRFFVVGRWVYMVKTDSVDSFFPEDFEDRDSMFSFDHIDKVVEAMNPKSNQVDKIAKAMPVKALFGEILCELQNLYPNLKHAAEPALDLELLYDPVSGIVVSYSGGIADDVKAKYSNAICAWVQRVWDGCYRIGVRGSGGISLYVVDGWLYSSKSESFNPNKKSTYASKEPYVHDSKWVMDKLKAASFNWLNPKPTNDRPRHPAAAAKATNNNWKSQRPAAPAKPANPVVAAKPLAWRSNDTRPTVDDDGFTAVRR